MNEPEKHYKTFGSIERTKRWVGRVGNYFYIYKQPRRLFRAQIRKNYPRCNSHDPIMGHVKIKNNIPVSPDKWIYEYDINPSIWIYNYLCLSPLKL